MIYERTPESFGADPTGVIDSTTEIQAAITWASGNKGYIKGAGMYKISDTITVSGSNFGFEFGNGNFGATSSGGGLFWGGTDNSPNLLDEYTAKPMLHFTGNQGLRCGSINISNRKFKTGSPEHLATGIAGILMTSPIQGSNNYFGPITLAGLDYGLILGLKTYRDELPELPEQNDDVAEQSIFEMIHTYEVKHPLYMDSATNDCILFNKMNLGSYKKEDDYINDDGTDLSDGHYINGESEYVIRSKSTQNGLIINDLLIAQYYNVKDDIALIDWQKGGLDIRKASIECGGIKARVIDLSASTGSRGMVLLRNLYTSDFRDSKGLQAKLKSTNGVLLEGVTWQGNVEVSECMVYGNCKFKQSYYELDAPDISTYNFTQNIPTEDNKITPLDQLLSVQEFRADENGTNSKAVYGQMNASKIRAWDKFDLGLYSPEFMVNCSNRLITYNTDFEVFTLKLKEDVEMKEGEEIKKDRDYSISIQIDCFLYRGGGLTRNFSYSSLLSYNLIQFKGPPLTSFEQVALPVNVNVVQEGFNSGSISLTGSINNSIPRKFVFQIKQLNSRGSDKNNDSVRGRFRIRIISDRNLTGEIEVPVDSASLTDVIIL